MTTFVVSNEHEALDALRLLAGEDSGRVRIRFKNFVKTVESPTPFEEMGRSKFFIALQRSIHREHCWIKYGEPNLHRLTEEDRRATKIEVTTSRDGRRVSYDLSAALNARIEAVESWEPEGPPSRLRTRDLFSEAGKEPTNPWGALAVVGKDIANKLGRQGLMTIAIAAVITGALAHAAPGVVHESLAYIGQRQDAANERQYRMALAERTTVVTHSGKEARLNAKDRLQIEREIESKRQLARSLVSDTIEQPLVRFVVAEAEATRPALLDMAPAWGTLTIDGVPMDAEAAKAGAKLLRRQAKDKAANGWQAKVFVARKA